MSIKRICLGTVQFGLDYGINNKKGKPKIDEVHKILDYALEKGIEIFDTANAYGDSEERLGEYIQKRKLEKDIKVVSKLKPNLFQFDKTNIESTVKKEVRKSLSKLKISHLEGYLLHTPSDMYLDGMIEILNNIKKEGFIKNIGVSVYEIEDAIEAAKNEKIDFIQLPYNIFDQRVDKSEVYEFAKKNDIKIFARSPFLQGLLNMDLNEVPINLELAKEYMKKLDNIISEFDISKEEAAIMFAFSNKNNDYIVFGIDDIDQLKKNIDIIENLEIKKAFVKEIQKNFLDVEKSIIFPSLWSKK